MTTEFEIFLKDNKKSPYEEEMKIFQERINDHGNRLSSLEELTEKAEMVSQVFLHCSVAFLCDNTISRVGHADVKQV